MNTELVNYSESALLFIKEYIVLEKETTGFGQKWIRKVFADDYFKEHLCESWSQRARDFGSFFLNLSTAVKDNKITTNYKGIGAI